MNVRWFVINIHIIAVLVILSLDLPFPLYCSLFSVQVWENNGESQSIWISFNHMLAHFWMDYSKSYWKGKSISLAKEIMAVLDFTNFSIMSKNVCWHHCWVSIFNWKLNPYFFLLQIWRMIYQPEINWIDYQSLDRVTSGNGSQSTLKLQCLSACATVLT